MYIFLLDNVNRLFCFHKVSYLIVDEMHAEHPELVKDAFWDEGMPEELPYTLAAEEFRAEPWQGSAAEVM